jgi:proteasome lid subunit RPN8/RPN11
VNAPAEEIDVAIIRVDPLYADPEYANLETITGATTYQSEFGIDGPIVVVNRYALDAAMSHAQAHLSVEVGGLCLGQVFKNRQDERLLIRVEQMVQAEHTIAGAAHVTFTYETWHQFMDVQTRDYPDLRLLGWYHSHPGFGVFLSSMDFFIHQSFFSMPWHIAVVVEPLQKQAGIFARHNEKMLPPQTFKWIVPFPADQSVTAKDDLYDQ